MSRPTARPTASFPASRIACTDAASRRDSTGKDCAVAPSNYITAGRLLAVTRDLDGRDRELLHFVSACRLASGKQLVRRFWTDVDEHDAPAARAGRRALKRLANWRVLDPLPGRLRGGVRGGSSTLVYKVGAAGAKLLVREGLHQRRLGAPGARFIAHTLAITEAVVDLHAADARGDLELIQLETEPSCWRSFLGAMGARMTVKPDLFVRVGVGALEDRWFVECDLATEHATMLLAKARRYLAHYRSGSEQRAHGTYPRVLWAVPDQARAVQVEQMTAKLPAAMRPMFTVCLLADVAGYLGCEARA